MKTKKIILLILACIACCGKVFAGGSQSQGSGGSQSGSTVAPPPVNQSSAPSVQKDVINVGMNTDPGNLAPFSQGSTGRTDLTDIVYQSLGCLVNGKIYGTLYKDYAFAADGMSVDVNLYETIHDQKRNPFKASDAAFSFNKSQELGSRPGFEWVKKAEAVSAYTVRFSFTRPLYANDLENLFENIYMVTEKAYNESPDGMATMPVTTSPYKVTKYTSGYIVTLEKDPDYWQTDKKANPPQFQTNVNTINYYILTELSQMTMALENGSIDMSWHVGVDDLPKFTQGGPQSSKFTVFQQPDNMIYLLMLNGTTGKPTANSDLRKAIYYAVDSQAILKGVFGGQGLVTYSVGHPGMPDYQKAWENEDNYYHYNLETAKSYLAKSGYKAGQLTLNLLCETTTDRVKTATLIQAFLSQLGINVKINAVQPAMIKTYDADANGWDIYVMGSGGGDYIVNFWKYQYLNAQFKWNGSLNFIFDDKLQTLLDASRQQATHNDQTVNAVHQYIVDNAYGMGLVNTYLNYIMPAECSALQFTFKKIPIPGACTYIK
jgi:ABC-type transport system substrate-binding protein